MQINIDVAKKDEIIAICKELDDTKILPYLIPVRVGLSKERVIKNFIRAIEKCYDIRKLDEVPEHIYDFYLRTVKPEPDSEKQEDPIIDDDESIPEIKEPPAEKPEAIKEPDDDYRPLHLDPPKRGRGRPKKIKGPTEDYKISAAIPPKPLPGRPPKIELPADTPKRGRGRPKKIRDELPADQPKSETPHQRHVSGALEAPKDRPEAHFVSKGRGRGLNNNRLTRAKVYCSIVTDGKPRTKQEIVAEMMRSYGGSNKEAPFWVGGYCNLLIALGKMKKKGNKFIYQENINHEN